MSKSNPETKDQKFHTEGGKLFATIQVELEASEAPPINQCRHAVLPILKGYVIYDRLLCRIVNGVYSSLGDVMGALGTALLYNERDDCPQDMNPTGRALGLIYPTKEELAKYYNLGEEDEVA